MSSLCPLKIATPQICTDFHLLIVERDGFSHIFFTMAQIYIIKHHKEPFRQIVQTCEINGMWVDTGGW